MAFLSPGPKGPDVVRTDCVSGVRISPETCLYKKKCQASIENRHNKQHKLFIDVKVIHNVTLM